MLTRHIGSAMEYGSVELYGTSEAQQDKHIINNVNMAKISGIMSQLGQLSTFASEVFNRINNKVDSISVRSISLSLYHLSLSLSLSLSNTTH